MAKYVVQKKNPNSTPIHPDEPYFILRPTDMFAAKIIQMYHDLLEYQGAPQSFLDDILEHKDRVLAWQQLNKDKVGFPD